jgi:hypothetical protein
MTRRVCAQSRLQKGAIRICYAPMRVFASVQNRRCNQQSLPAPE